MKGDGNGGGMATEEEGNGERERVTGNRGGRLWWGKAMEGEGI